MSRRFASAVLATIVSAAPFSIASAYAQTATTASIADAVAVASTVQFAADQTVASLPRVNPRADEKWTAPVLGSLQVALVATQLLDAHSTLRAVNGRRRGEPDDGRCGEEPARSLAPGRDGRRPGLATHRMDRQQVAHCRRRRVNSVLAMLATTTVARSLQ
jgi:hypothetical protein